MSWKPRAVCLLQCPASPRREGSFDPQTRKPNAGLTRHRAGMRVQGCILPQIAETPGCQNIGGCGDENAIEQGGAEERSVRPIACVETTRMPTYNCRTDRPCEGGRRVRHQAPVWPDLPDLCAAEARAFEAFEDVTPVVPPSWSGPFPGEALDLCSPRRHRCTRAPGSRTVHGTTAPRIGQCLDV